MPDDTPDVIDDAARVENDIITSKPVLTVKKDAARLASDIAKATADMHSPTRNSWPNYYRASLYALVLL